MQRLIYAVPADLGSGAAHAVHVVKMGQALAQSLDEVVVWVRKAPSPDVITRMFETTVDLTIREAGSSAVRGLGGLSFALEVSAAAGRADWVLTRHLLTACLTAARGIPTVLELHSPVETLREKALFRLFLASSGIRGFVTITHALAGRFTRDFGKRLAPHLHVLADAADPRRQGPQPATEQVAPTVGYIGGFLPGKGIELVLEIANRMPSVRFELVGGTADDVNGLGVPPNVTLAGRLSHAKAMERLDDFAIVLLPNQQKVLVSGGKIDIGAWTSPLKLFEYMAAAKPIVASRLPVLQEVLSDGCDCLMASPADPDEWARKIQDCLDDPGQAAHLGKMARAKFLANHTWSIRARKLETIFARGNPA